MNSVNLIGRLGDDPQLRYLPSNKAVCQFSIALTEKWRDQSGQMQERTSWVDIDCFAGTAEAVNQYVRKGDRIAISGRLQQDVWEKDGQRRSKLKVVADRFDFIESKPDTRTSTRPDTSAAHGGDRHQPAEDEDIPFM